MRPSDAAGAPASNPVRATIRFFASAREAVGSETLEWTLEPGTTVGDLLERLDRDYPGLASLRGRLLISVNQRYAGRDQVLADGDEVGVIPPVSGGSGDGPETGRPAGRRVWTSKEPLDINELYRLVEHRDAGAVLLFVGTVRERTGDQVTRSLRYEAYPEMAEREMESICRECEQRWPGVRVAMAHRYGDLDIGEASVMIAVSSPHRGEAYEASRHAIEELKVRVPVWKKELWADGTETWVNHS